MSGDRRRPGTIHRREDDEVAFYDALAANDSAVEAMGKDELKVIAAELVTQVRKSVTIDWTLRESARAKIKVMVKRILRKHGYPPDLQDEAVKTVLAQPNFSAPIGPRRRWADSGTLKHGVSGVTVLQPVTRGPLFRLEAENGGESHA